MAGLQFKPSSLSLTGIQRILLAIYKVAWHVGLPLAFLYLWSRGRKEPLYHQFLNERFGRIQCTVTSPFWLHSASLGELRGVMPLIDKLLAEGLPVFVSTLTPAGRKAAQARYAQEIAEGRLQVGYLPMELSWAIRSFVDRVKPRCMVSSEIDTWPVLLDTLKALGIPLGFVNAQYPQKSFIKDQAMAGFRAAFFRAYDVVLCKSQLHADRFTRIGCTCVEIVGELRFDLLIPQAQLLAAERLREHPALCLSHRAVICLASVIEGEDEMLLQAYQEFASEMQKLGRQRPLLVYVPRSPQRFDVIASQISQLGWKLMRRSVDLDASLAVLREPTETVDVFLGDSLGEMYFYLALANIVTVCGSFVDSGSHNVIEPLALHKQVIVGPSIWGIEYPGQEALAAGVLQQVPHAQALPAKWLAWFAQADSNLHNQQRAQDFMKMHAGSVDKHWHHLSEWLKSYA